jgi:hypothetical protein
MKPLKMYTARVRERKDTLLHKANTRLREPSSWALPKQSSSIAPDYVWANAGIVPRLQSQPTTNAEK